MKKIVLLLAVLFALGVNSYAQSTTNYYYENVGVNDTLGSVNETLNVPILFQIPEAVYYNNRVKVTNDGSLECTIALQGKVFDTDSYTTITTITYTGVGSDTTVVFSQPTTKQVYRYYNVLITRTAGVGTFNFAKFSLKY